MALRILILATAAACLATTSLALETPAPTELEGVTVVADTEIRLTVAVGGDIGESTFVASAPAGLTCGGAQYQYMTRENRQCWLRVRRKTDVILTAQANGRYGVDWSVEWVGCEPVGNGAACRIKPLEETQVAALFTRR